MPTDNTRDIDFIIMRNILLELMQKGMISEPEYRRAESKIRSETNCKLIVTSEK